MALPNASKKGILRSISLRSYKARACTLKYLPSPQRLLAGSRYGMQAWLSAREGKSREQDAKKKAWEDACFKIPPFKPSKIL